MSDDVTITKVNGIRLAYRSWGAPDAPGTPVVLLHCLGEDGEDWRGPLVAQLAVDHRVYAPDLRGHGHSDRPGAYGLDDVCDDVLGLLDALGLERVLLVGHSYGSIVAYLLAGAHPERVERLVLEETGIIGPVDPPLEETAAPDGPLGFDWEVKTQFTRQRNAPDPAWARRPEAITAPTLLIGGGPTSHLPQEDLAVLAARIPDATLVTIDGAGHLVHEERPVEFAGAVRTFLAGGERAPVQ